METREVAILAPCVFHFGNGDPFAGVTDGTRWNGFLNVRVTPKERDEIARRWSRDGRTESETIRDLEALPVGDDGLVSLANGYATEPVTCWQCERPATRVDGIGGAFGVSPWCDACLSCLSRLCDCGEYVLPSPLHARGYFDSDASLTEGCVWHSSRECRYEHSRDRLPSRTWGR